MGSDPVKTALFTGSQQFHTLWKRCEKHVRKHVKLNSSHVFSQVNSQVFHSIFTCFYPIVKSGRVGITALRGGEWYLEKRGSWKNLGRISKYISKAFLISLEVSFLHGLFYVFWVLKLFTKESHAQISNQDLGISASLGFYHSPPLHLKISMKL